MRNGVFFPKLGSGTLLFGPFLPLLFLDEKEGENSPKSSALQPSFKGDY
jgi:hypothetical protein